MENLLEIRGLVLKAGKSTLLDLPSLDVYKNEVLILLGPNGAGKSTLLRAAAGLMKPTSGYIRFADEPQLTELEYRRKVSTVFQSPLLLSDTVSGNIATGLAFRGLSKNEIRERVDHWMDLLHITHLQNRRAKVLSGGEAQRVSLARAFCLETELILMDEPFSAVDAPTRQELLEDLRNILSKTNQTCIYVTHDIDEALTIGDRVGVMFAGNLHQVGPVQSTFDHPKTPEVAAFMGVGNIIPGVVSGIKDDVLAILSGDVTLEATGQLPAGSNVFICLRPEDITLYSADEEIRPSTARNRLLCRITGMFNQGSLIRIELDAGINLIALVTRPSVEELGLKVGKNVYAVFKASAIHLLPARSKGPVI
ncbi:MAG: ABC transporter ATP-binding protein [Leptolinea sp.]|jgi:tungstate transport system ATP-binding protein|nr:ABC transporter ATP-binding protein [Leptolinea sp.]